MSFGVPELHVKRPTPAHLIYPDTAQRSSNKTHSHSIVPGGLLVTS